MSKARPLLLLLVPPDLEVDPAALRALQQHVGDEYGAGLWVRPLGFPAQGSQVRLLGDWKRLSAREVHAGIAGSLVELLYTLDWLEASA